MIELFFRVVNGLITLYIFYLLFKLYNETKRQFYRYWSLGFLFYGANIILRIFVPTIEMNPLGFLAFLLNLLGFIIMMTGIGELINKAKVTFAVSLIIQIALSAVVFSGGSESLAWTMVLVPYLVIIISLGYLYFTYQVKIITIVIGWFAIFLANMALSFNYLDILYVDVMSILGKIIVYNGMVQPNFSFLADDLRKFILSGLPVEFSHDHDGGVILINLPKALRSQDAKWINDKVLKNKSQGVRTILFSFYDLIETSSITEDAKGSLYLVRIIPGHREFENLFENQVITINDDPSLIQIVLDDIVSASNETTVPTEIILYNLTNAIIIHGWNRMYSMILTKIPQLKKGKVKLTCFYYPEAHSDPTIVSKFESIADKIIRE